MRAQAPSSRWVAPTGPVIPSGALTGWRWRWEEAQHGSAVDWGVGGQAGKAVLERLWTRMRGWPRVAKCRSAGMWDQECSLRDALLESPSPGGVPAHLQHSSYGSDSPRSALGSPHAGDFGSLEPAWTMPSALRGQHLMRIQGGHMGKAVAVSGVRRRMKGFFLTHQGRRDMAAGQRGHIFFCFWEGCSKRLWDPHPGHVPAPVGMLVTQQLCLQKSLLTLRTSELGDGTRQKFL